MQRISIVGALVVLFLIGVPTLLLGAAAQGQSTAAPGEIPRYQHIFVIMMENHGYNQIIGGRYTPRVARLAQTYGLATKYYGVTHPSEPNYLATIGGSYFGIYDDWSYTVNVKNDMHTQHGPSLATQLMAKGLTWKSYQESLPYPGFMGEFYPDGTHPLYAVKHNPFLFFADIQNSKAALRHIVPLTRLVVDLRAGTAPNFSYIVPNQCHDMHGTTGTCPYAVKPLDLHDQALMRQGDAFVANLVSTIMGSSLWTRGANAVVVVWDEDDASTSGTLAGCCGSLRGLGGGHIPAIVITNHGPRGVRDSTPYNHYALLQTVQRAFGLGCLRYTCDTAHVTPMARLFANRP